MDIIIEFAGMPKSGKTTILEIVRHELRRNNKRLIDFHGGGRYAPIDKDYLSELNMYLATEAARFVLTTKTQDSPRDRIALMDRGIFDRLIFTEALRNRGTISDKEASATTDFLLSERLVKSIDAVFVFKTSSQLSIEREQRNKLGSREGRIMNEELLSALRAAVDVAVDRYQRHFRHVALVDTERLDGRLADTASEIMSQFDAALCNGA